MVAVLVAAKESGRLVARSEEHSDAQKVEQRVPLLAVSMDD